MISHDVQQKMYVLTRRRQELHPEEKGPVLATLAY